MNDAFGRPQTALVVGGGSDLALAVLDRLDATLVKIVLAARRPDELASAVADRFRAAVRTVDFDAADLTGHATMVDAAVEFLGDIDLAIVSHGDLGQPFGLETTPEEVATLITVNHAGAAAASQAVARRLATQGHGTLVVFSSVAAVRPRLGNLPYASSKAGLDAFALGLDHALADTGARVMVVRPGFVHTKMTAGLAPQPLATDAATVADAVVDGLAKGKSVVWAPAPLALTPALRLVPKALWRRLSER